MKKALIFGLLTISSTVFALESTIYKGYYQLEKQESLVICSSAQNYEKAAEKLSAILNQPFRVDSKTDQRRVFGGGIQSRSGEFFQSRRGN